MNGDKVPLALAFLVCALATDAVLRRAHRKEANKRYAEKTQQVAILIKNADERLSWSASRIAKAIRDGEFTSVEITLAYMKHLSMVNLYINAMVASRFDRALVEAHEADEIVAHHRKTKSPTPPFLGVPMMSKEVFELPGMPFSAGVFALRQRYGKRTAFAIGKVQREGGVIILGKRSHK